MSNSNIDIDSTNNRGYTPIHGAMRQDKLEAAKLLVSKGANLFLENNNGKSALDHRLGPQVLQHGKDLVWDSIKPIILLSTACSPNAIPSNSSIAIPNSLIQVIGNSDLARHISLFLRAGVILCDPAEDEDEKEPDEVKLRVEAKLASASKKIAK